MMQSAKMRAFRSQITGVEDGVLISKEGPLVWVLWHPLIENKLRRDGIPEGMRDWRNYDFAKLADDFRRFALTVSAGTNPASGTETAKEKTSK